MSYNMIEIAPKTLSYSGTRTLSSVLYIVIHNTANKGDTAVNNGNYFKNVNTNKAGSHFFVDQKGNIVYSVSIDKNANAVGGGRYSDYKQTGGAKYYNKCTNKNSISIELCDIVDKEPSDDMVKACAWLIQYIQTKCVNAKTIIRHFDVNGKHCPMLMMDNNAWNKFLLRLNSAIGSNVVKQENNPGGSFLVKVIDDDLNIRSGPGVNYKVNGVIRDYGIYTIVETNGSWGRLKSGSGWISINPKYVKRL